jgi:non-ribosomal peptide synthetase component F
LLESHAHKPLADSWLSFCRFYNSCGPTETTIINTAQHYSESCDELTIGKPTPKNTVYVLDEDLKPCAIGEVGEMLSGGLCVTSGYIGNEVLNADRYRPDPFLGGKYKMFRTRDLGKWNKNGELIHLRRTDAQVKIFGSRVELDSVSRVLEKNRSLSPGRHYEGRLQNTHRICYSKPC